MKLLSTTEKLRIARYLARFEGARPERLGRLGLLELTVAIFPSLLLRYHSYHTSIRSFFKSTLYTVA